MQLVNRLFLLLLCCFSLTLSAEPFYWVNGSGNWNDVSHWATTSGGTTFYANTPSANDDVFIDANSFTGPDQSIDLLNIAAQCRNLTITTNRNGASLVSGGGAELQVHGDLRITGSLNWALGGGELILRGSNGPATIDPGGRPLSGDITINGQTAAGTFTIVGNLDGVRFFTIERGSVNFADGARVSARDIEIGNDGTTDYANLTLNAEAIELDLNAAELPSLRTCRIVLRARGRFTVDEVTNPRFQSITTLADPDRPEDPVRLQNQETGGTLAADSIVLSSNTEVFTSLTADFVRMAAGSNHDVQLDGGTFTIADRLFIEGTCAEPVTISTSNLLTVTAPAAATIDVTGVQLVNVAATGGATFDATESGGLGTLTGWNFINPNGDDRYWVGGNGSWDDEAHWAYTSGGPGGACLPRLYNDVFFDAASFTANRQTVTIPEGSWTVNSLDWRGNDDNASLDSDGTLSIYGSLFLTNRVDWVSSGSIDLFFRGPGTNKRLRTNGGTDAFNLTFDGAGGEWRLLDSLSTRFTIELLAGRLDTDNQSVSCGEIRHTESGFLDLAASTVYIPFLDADDSEVDRTEINLQPRSTGSGGYDAANATIINLNELGRTAIRLRNRGGLPNQLRRIYSTGYVNMVSNTVQIEEVELLKSADFRLVGSIDDFTLSGGGIYQFAGNSGGRLAINNFTADGSCSAPIVLQSMVDDYGFTSTNDQAGTYLQILNLDAYGATWTVNAGTDLGGTTGWVFSGTPTSRTLYWVDGAGDWFDPDHWSLTSDGPGGECLPTPIDDVIFDAASFNAADPTVRGTDVGGGFIPQCRAIDARMVDEAVTFEGGELNFHGSAYFAPAVRLNWGQLIFQGSNVEELLPPPTSFSTFTLSGPGTLNLLGPITPPNPRNFRVYNGRFNTNGYRMDLSFLDFRNATPDAPGPTTLDLADGLVTLNNIAIAVQMNFASEARIVSQPGGTLRIQESGNVTLGTNINGLNLEFAELFNDPHRFRLENPSGGDPPARFNRIDFESTTRIDGPFRADTVRFNRGYAYDLASEPGEMVVRDRLIAVGTACNPISWQPDNNQDRSSFRLTAAAEAEMDYVRLDRVDGAGPGARLAGRNSTNINDSSNGWTFETNAVVQSLDRFFLGPDRESCNPAGEVIMPNVPIGFVAEYEWQDGSTDPSFTAPGPGTYSLSITFGEDDCLVADEITLTGAGLDLLADQTIPVCGADRYTITVPNPGAEGYTWTVLMGGIFGAVTETEITVSVPATVELRQVVGDCEGTTLYVITGGATAVTNVDVPFCPGDTYTTVQNTYTPSDGQVETEVYTAVNGCDSTVVYTFESGEAAGAVIPVSGCANRTYDLGGVSYFVTQDTTVTAMLTTVAGCDSIQPYAVTVTPPVRDTLRLPDFTDTELVTPQNTYPVDGDITITEQYTAVLTGCDSTQVYIITLPTTVTNTTPVFLCGPEDFLTDLGTYFIRVDTSFTERYTLDDGRDSLETYTIIVGPGPLLDTLPVGLCEPGPLLVGDATYFVTQDTFITEAFVLANGCDSTVVTAVAIGGATTRTTFDTLCSPGPFVTQQTTYAVERDTFFIETYPLASGCDSVHTFNVSLTPALRDTTYPIICPGAEFITPQNVVMLTEDTEIEENYTTSNGCDSIHTYFVMVRAEVRDTSPVSICAGQPLVTEQASYPINVDTLITEAYTSSTGCDSLHTYLVSVSGALRDSSRVMLCEGADFVSPQQTYIIGVDTVITELYTAGGGCDSLHTYLVVTSERLTDTSSVIICQGSPFVSPQQTYLISQDTTIEENYTTSGGCDSVQVYLVSLSQALRDTASVVLCTGGDVLTTGQATYVITSDTLIEESYVTAGGCDSLQVYLVTLRDSIATEQERTLCAGTLLTTPQRAYTINVDTSITERYTALSGCDSLVTYLVRVRPPLNVALAPLYQLPPNGVVLNPTIIPTNQMVMYQWSTSGAGVQLSCLDCATPTVTATEAGEVLLVITDASGCTAMVSALVEPLPGITTQSTVALCPGDSLMTPLRVYVPLRDTVITERYMAASGVDSFRVTTVLVSQIPTNISINFGNISCTDANDAFLEVTTAVAGVNELRLNGQLLPRDTLLDSLPPGTYELQLEYGAGCLLARTYEVTNPEPLRVELPETIVVLAGEATTVDATVSGGVGAVGLRYGSPDSTFTLSCMDCNSTTLRPELSGPITVTAIDDNGCVAQDSVRVTVVQQRRSYLPTAFSPNGDGVNDRLTVFGRGGSGQISYLRVFDRWGRLVFEQGNLTLNDQSAGWDGGEAPVGNYVVTYEVLWRDGRRTSGSGSVQLLR